MLSKNRDLTTGSITAGLWAFAIPLMLGNVLQQFYNLADTWVVLHAADVPDVNSHRAVPGHRGFRFNGIRQAR